MIRLTTLSFRKPILLGLLLLAALTSRGQTPDDGFHMNKGQICIAVPYSYDAWTEYWEGTLLRDNPNLGTVSRQMILPMFALGVNKHLDVIVALPYVWTAASAGTTAGHKGLQDLNVFVKGKLPVLNLNENSLKPFLTVGFSTPVSDYYPDYLPLSIGLASTQLMAKATLHLELKSGLFATATGGYAARGPVEIERDYYYTSSLGGVNSNEVKMPDVADYRFALGYVNSRIKANFVCMGMNTLGGDDIRRNDMPFPSYNMDQLRIGAEAQIYLMGDKGLSLLAFGNHTLSGRNMGLSTAFGGGIAWQFNQLW